MKSEYISEFVWISQKYLDGFNKGSAGSYDHSENLRASIQGCFAEVISRKDFLFSYFTVLVSTFSVRKWQGNMQ